MRACPRALAVTWRSSQVARALFDVAALPILGPMVPLRSIHYCPARSRSSGSGPRIVLLIGCVGQGEFATRFGRKAVYQFNLLLYGVAAIACRAGELPMALRHVGSPPGSGLV